MLNWVYATAQFGFLTAYDRFVRTLSDHEKHEYWTGGDEVAKLYGVTNVAHSEAEFLAMMEPLVTRFEPHQINSDFLEIVSSGRARPEIPKFIHKALARAAVDILPPIAREKLGLGPEWNLSGAERLMVKFVGRLADKKVESESPAYQAALRLGLPGDTAWRR